MSIIKSIVASGSFYVLDTETTGLDMKSEICQIAVINQDGEPILNSLVKPRHPIPPQAIAIHGITNEMVADAPSFNEVYEQLKAVLVPNIPIFIYNAPYDVRLMFQSLDPQPKDLLPNSIWDIMEPFAELYGDWNDYHQSYTWKSLGTAYCYFGHTITKAHDALADCLMTLAVIKGMAKKEEVK